MSNVLRGFVVAGVTLALLLGAVREQATRSGVQRIDGDVITFTDTRLLVRSTVTAPDLHALDALAGMAETAPLLAALPPAPRLDVWLPQQLMAGRAAGLTFSLVGAPGTAARVELVNSRGVVVDSADHVLDGNGDWRGAFRVRPAREGWHEWSVRAAGETHEAGAWVLPERTPRVLLAAGPPSPESRFIARALEETGVEVELHQPLGHGLTAGAPSALATFDVVILLHDAVLDAARRTALEQYVAEHGGGLLIAARDPLLHALGLTAGEQPDARSVRADELLWTLPPELTRLPAGAESSVAEPFAAAADAFTAASAADGTTLLVLRSIGHGRAAGLALRETWRWRVAAGRADEHRDFWRSLVDWLSSPPAVPRIERPRPIAAPGLPVLLDIEADAPLPLRLQRPDGVMDPLTTEPLPPARVAGGYRDQLAFLPVDTGVYTVLLDDRETAGVRVAGAAGHAVAGPVASADAGALLALIADGSGGQALPAGQLAAAVRARDAVLPTRLPWRLPLLLLLLGFAVADWTLRRLRGAA